MPQPILHELQKLKDEVEKVYLVKDPYIVKFLVAQMITHKLTNDPAWAVIVGASGAGKSEFINMLGKCNDVYPVSTLTSHTFISGARSQTGETSLLLKIKDKDGKNNGIITFKDLTSLLSENKDERAVIMAQLREIYDGKYSKQFGTGMQVKWEGKITVVAGATYAIHTLRQSYTAMGERFVFYNLISPDRKEAARRTMQNQEQGDMMIRRDGLADRLRDYVENFIKIPEKIPPIEHEMKEGILDLSELATRARSETERNWRSPQMEITEVHPPEMPTRFAGVLMTYLQALRIINYCETGKFDIFEEDIKILNKIALDSITKSKRIAMQELAKYDWLETAGIATKINMPTNTVRRWLEDLNALGVADRIKQGGPKGDKWSILKKYREIIIKFEDLVYIGGDLEGEDEGYGNIVPQGEIDASLKVEEKEINVKEIGLWKR